jgi:opacity protein-like surface antigen
MKNILLVCALAAMTVGMLRAQESPLMEAYGGYTFVRVNTGTQVNAFTTNGGVASFQYNINTNLGFLAEFGGTHQGDISVSGPAFPFDQTQVTYLFGPRVFVNKEHRYSPFIELLFGGIHNSRSYSIATSVLPANYVVPAGVTREVGATTTKFRTTQNAYAMAMGGGLDIKLSPAVAVRPIQLDYLPSHFSPLNVPGVPRGINDTNWQHNLRYSAGVVFRFGSTNQ